MTEKKQIANYVKLMKTMVKYVKNGYSKRMFCQYDKENEVVYISDGCCIFPIPKDIYVENSILAKCPMLLEIESGNPVNLKGFIMETVNDTNSTECLMTKILLNLGKGDEEKLTHIYRCKDELGVLDKKYVELIGLLPPVLSAYNPIAKDIKSPVVGYTENYTTMGYAILPIYCKFEDIMSALGFIREN